MADPLYLDRDGHRTWIKWHRARRKAGDPVFTGARILEGMRLGASVEVDLVIHGDHGCAVLHNFTLDAETTGGGEVRQTPATTLRALCLRADDGTVLPDRVMLLEDLCGLLITDPPHPAALLQLDFKEQVAALDPLTIANFAASVAPVANSMILSGGDFGAIDTLCRATPGLRSGYDPCYGESLAQLQATGDFLGFIQTALATAPDAGLIYLSHEIILAADKAGFDVIRAVHEAGRCVDAWTINAITPATIPLIDRLLSLEVDQITTDDPESMLRAFAK